MLVRKENLGGRIGQVVQTPMFIICILKIMVKSLLNSQMDWEIIDNKFGMVSYLHAICRSVLRYEDFTVVISTSSSNKHLFDKLGILLAIIGFISQQRQFSHHKNGNITEIT